VLPARPRQLAHSRYAWHGVSKRAHKLTDGQGINGLTARDIKLVIEGGYNTIESIAYT
jgi:hypothetical protein